MLQVSSRKLSGANLLYTVGAWGSKMSDPLAEFHTYSDISLYRLGPRRPAGIGAILVTPNGYICDDHSEFIGQATAPQAELVAILAALRLATRLRNADQRIIRAHTDSIGAWYYLHKNWGQKDHLIAIRNDIREVEQAFLHVAYEKVGYNNTAIRRCETLARRALEDKGYSTTHRGSKGQTDRRTAPVDPLRNVG